MKAAVSWRTTLVFKHTSAREKYFLQCGIRYQGRGGRGEGV